MTSGALVDQKPRFASAITTFHFTLPVLRVERDEVRVGRGQVDGVLVDRRAAMADVKALVRRIGVAPQLPRRARVDRPDVVGRRDVDHAVDEDRRRLDLLASGPVWNAQASVSWWTLSGVICVRRLWRWPGVVAVIGRPAVGRRLEQRGGIEPLRRAERRSTRARQRCRSRTAVQLSAKRLQVRQDIVHVVIGVLSELLDVSLERIVDGELHPVASERRDTRRTHR